MIGFDFRAWLRQRIVEEDRGYQTRCWVWQKCLNEAGYAYGSVPSRRASKPYRIHRIAYQEMIGPIPSGLVLDHLCRIRNCVNPAHLEPVTIYENLRRGNAWKPKEYCRRGHALTPENRDPSHANSCRTCRREVTRRANAKRSLMLRNTDASHCAAGHELTAGNRGAHGCKTCWNAYMASRRALRREETRHGR